MRVRPSPRVPVFARNAVESEDCRAVVKRRRANVTMLSASYDSASQPEKEQLRIFYVYILQSEVVEKTFYVGFTEDLSFS